MKKIDTSNIAGLAKAPFIKDTHDHIKQSIQESTGDIVKGILGSPYTTGDLIVLYGCQVTISSGSIPGTGTATLAAGAIYYNGEIYEVDANAGLSTTANTLVWNIATTYIAADSALVWSDGVTRNLHRIDKLVLSAGTAGTGIANFNDTTVKYNRGTSAFTSVTFTGGTATINTNTFKYVKFGGMVHMSFNIIYTSTSGFSPGATIAELTPPTGFAPIVDGFYGSAVVNGSGTTWPFLVYTESSVIKVADADFGTVFPSGNQSIRGSIVYPVI